MPNLELPAATNETVPEGVLPDTDETVLEGVVVDDIPGESEARPEPGTGGERKPIIPDHWRTREARRQHIRMHAARHGHRAAYHGVRAPSYGVRATGYALRGIVVTGHRLIRWWHVPGMYELEHRAAMAGNVGEHLRLHIQGRETRKARGIMLGVGFFFLAGAGVATYEWAPWYADAVLSAVTFAALVKAGRPQGRKVIEPAVVPDSVQPPTTDVIIRALGSIGISEISKAISSNTFPPFPEPVREDGPGWRASVDLPYGVTATQVIERREQLASGLRRPLGAVWPSPVTSEHAGRLELFVGRQDISKGKPIPSPLVKSGAVNIFEPVPFGVNVKGQPVKVPLIYNAWLVGSQPRNGKTATLRGLTAAASLDPLAELWIAELKGSGDLDAFEQVSHRFVSGIDDASIAYAAESLSLLRAEVEKRTKRLKELPREMCPDKRVTREIASKKSLRLRPVICVIDECQNLFADESVGKQAGEDAAFIMRIGPAFGVVLVLATQRPDSKSLPTAVSANASQRFCLRIADQIGNDMVLGTSSYRNGVRATQFRPVTDAGLGWQVGAGDQAQVVRTYYIDTVEAEKVAKRARALREAAGTLSGVALGEDDSVPERDVLQDVLDVFGSQPGIHWSELAERLAEHHPARWASTTADAVSAELRSRGVPSVPVKVAGEAARGCRRADVETAAGNDLPVRG